MRADLGPPSGLLPEEDDARLRRADRAFVRGAWVAWGVFAVATGAVSALTGLDRTVAHNFREASLQWWARGDIYGDLRNIGGFLYFPQAAVLWSPFAWMPVVVGEVVWRAASIALLASSAWRLSRLASPRPGAEPFPLVTLLLIPTALGSARNGQMNLAFSAMMALACADLAREQWKRAAAWLSLAMALKPLTLALLLIVAALRPRRMIPSLAAGAAAVLAFPLLTAPPAYVLRQYTQCVEKLRTAIDPPPGLYSSLWAIPESLGVVTPHPVMSKVAAVCSLAALGLSWLAWKRLGRDRGPLAVLGVAAAYIMLFNSRTEGLTYVVLAPAVATLAAWEWFATGRRAVAAMLIGICVILAFSRNLIGPNLWLRPTVTLMFAGYLTALAARPPRERLVGAEG